MMSTIVPNAGSRFHLHIKSSDAGVEAAVMFGSVSIVIDLLFGPLLRLFNMLANAWNNILRMLSGQFAENVR